MTTSGLALIGLGIVVVMLVVLSVHRHRTF
jgi:hypothetical protein